MQASHDLSHVSADFDEDNLVACAGLVPVMALAQRAGLSDLAAEHLRLKGPGAPNAPAKVACLVAGMAAGADSIEDMDLLRHGAMTRLFRGLRAPSTLGTFLRSFTFGHARQLEAVATRFLAGLAARAPLLPGADAVSFVDVDDTVKATYGYAKAPSGSYPANAAWLACAGMTYNLLRAAGTLTGKHPREGPRSDPAHPPGHRPRPGRDHRPTPGPAPTHRLALGRRLDPASRRRPRHRPPTSGRRGLTRGPYPPPPQGPTGNPQWKSRTDRQRTHAQSQKRKS